MSGKRSPSRSEQSLFSYSAPNPIIFHHVRQQIPSPILTQIQHHVIDNKTTITIYNTTMTHPAYVSNNNDDKASFQKMVHLSMATTWVKSRLDIDCMQVAKRMVDYGWIVYYLVVNQVMRSWQKYPIEMSKVVDLVYMADYKELLMREQGPCNVAQQVQFLVPLACTRWRRH